MTIELQLIESLKTTISVQADLIAQLKLQIESLKASQITISAPSPMPVQPQGAYPPNQQPWVPGGGATGPFPYNPFTYTTSGGSQGVALTGDPLPVGSVQIQTGSNTSAVSTTDYTKIMNQHHNDITGQVGAIPTSNVVSMYESIIKSTPLPTTTEVSNGLL